MSDTKNAVVLVSHTNGDVSFAKGAVIRDMPANQFADLRSIGLVRVATDEEVVADAATADAPLAPALLPDATPVAPAAEIAHD
jgi:hypothetical protein